MVDSRYIIIDTREKRPWSFKSQLHKALKHGDYSIYQGTTKIVIERKSLIDLVGTLSGQRYLKFFAKMQRATQALPRVYLFIEANLTELYHEVPHSSLPTHILINRLLNLMEIGVQVIFTGGGKKGAIFAESLLRKLG